MLSERPAAVAGLFYPDDPVVLQRTVDALLSAVIAEEPVPRAIIAPHAGYVYSGAVAASVYATLRGARGHYTRVLLLGPAHRVAVRGLARSSADRFVTPLGAIALDHAAMADLDDLHQVITNDAAHAQEHSLEVQLPFLQVALGSFTLLPLVVGEASPQEVKAVLDRFWDDAATLIVISTDLSHFHDYQTAQACDQRTSAAIEACNWKALGYEDACGRNPLRGLLLLAEERGLSVSARDLRNSGDTAGPRDRVVGYGAYVVN